MAIVAEGARCKPNSALIDTMRTGVDPNGHQTSEQMPWRPLGRMDDEELAAVYKYLTHLPSS